MHSCCDGFCNSPLIPPTDHHFTYIFALSCANVPSHYSCSSFCSSLRRAGHGLVVTTAHTNKRNPGRQLLNNHVVPAIQRRLEQRKINLPAPATTTMVLVIARVAVHRVIPVQHSPRKCNPHLPASIQMFRCKSRHFTLPANCLKPFTSPFGSHLKLAHDSTSIRRVHFR